MIGDMQTTYLIQKELLLLLLQKYSEKKLPYYHTYELSLWGFLIQSAYFPQNMKEGFMKITKNFK